MRNRGRILNSNLMTAGPFLAHTYAYPGGAVESTTPNVQRTLGSTYQEYSDETISDDGSSKGRGMKAVKHERYAIDRQSLPFDEYRSGAHRYDLAGPNAHWESWGAYAGDLSSRNLQIVWSKTEDTLYREARDKFFNATEVEGLLNAVEFPQLVTLGRSIERLVKLGLGARSRIVRKVTFSGVKAGLKESISITTRRNNGLRKKVTLRGFSTGALSTVTGLHLGWSFGVAPIISDMRKLSRATASFKRRLAQAAASAGTEVSVHAKTSGRVVEYLIPDTGTGLLPVGYGTGPDVGKYWTTSPKSEGVCVQVATVTGVRSIRYSMDVFKRLDFLISRFGAGGPASLAWELVPFSFVLDWFVDLHEVLNAVDNALTGSTRHISGACVSRKWDAICDVYHTQINSTNTSIYDGKQVAQVRLSSYTRSPMSLNNPLSLSGRFGKKQALLTASLIGQLTANLRALR